MELHQLTAIELRDRFLEGKVKAEEIVRHFLDRIDRIDDKIGAFLAVFNDKALEKAMKLDRKREEGKPLGKLAGVPVALKDNMHLEGETTTCASNFLTNYNAPFSCTVARLLEEEDAVIIGKTNLDEFAMGSSTEHSALKTTRNPWNLDCIPGGSSGGSAACVAARLCPVAFGSDTGGSIRQPASLCGVVGFKPTYGRVSRYGLVAFGSSLDQIGPFAANADDAALMMEVVGRHCEKDSTSIREEPEEYLSKMQSREDLNGIKVGVPWGFLSELKDEPKQIFKNAIGKLKEQGAEIVEVDLDLLKYSVAIYYILATAEASTNLARFDGVRYGQRSSKAKTLDEVYDFSKDEGFGFEVKRRILLGTYVLSSGFQEAFFRQAQKVRTLFIERFEQAFKKCAIIAMPTSPSDAFEIGAVKDPVEMYLEDIYSIAANIAGIPAISVPSGLTKAKKPIGLQLLGPQKSDSFVFEVAKGFEKVSDFKLEEFDHGK